MSDIEVAVSALLEKKEGYEKAESYATGENVEVFANQRLSRILKANQDFRINFAGTVIDAVVNRLEIAAVQGTKKSTNKKIGEVWQNNNLDLEQNDIHRNALKYGDAYLMVWPVAGEFQTFYNSPLTTVIVYDDEFPRLKRFAAKMWEIAKDDPNGPPQFRLNLYYPDRVEKYISKSRSVKRATDWMATEVVPNPFGEIPVFHFRTHRPFGIPEHKDAYGPQDAINKLTVTQMTTVDYQGAPQRYALAAGDNSSELEDFGEGDTDRENFGALKHGPGELWYLKGVTNVGQFAPADPGAFLQPLREYVRAMASTTSTPLHYFEPTGNVPSGEALRVAEAPLLKKVKDRQMSFGATWREVFNFILKAEGVEDDTQVRWKVVESMDQLDEWELNIKKRQTGMPLSQVLREAGYDEEIIEEIERLKESNTPNFPNDPRTNRENGENGEPINEEENEE